YKCKASASACRCSLGNRKQLPYKIASHKLAFFGHASHVRRFCAETMKTTKIKVIIYLLGFGGAALFTILLVRQGVMSVGSAVATAGWAIAGIAAFHFVPILLDTLASRVLFPKAVRQGRQSLFWM